MGEDPPVTDAIPPRPLRLDALAYGGDYNAYPSRINDSARDPFADQAHSLRSASNAQEYPPLPYDSFNHPYSSTRDTLDDDGHDDYGIPRGARNFGSAGAGGAEKGYYSKATEEPTKGGAVRKWIWIALAALIIM